MPFLKLQSTWGQLYFIGLFFISLSDIRFLVTCMCFIGGDEQYIWHEIKGPRGKIITIITNASLLRNVHYAVKRHL